LFLFLLKNIVRIKKSELNQDFFDKVYGAGTVTSEEQMREKIKENLDSEYQKFTNTKLERDIQAYLLSESKIELPLDFLRRLMNTNREEGQPEFNDQQFQAATNQFKWDLIFGRLVRDHQITPSEEEMKS